MVARVFFTDSRVLMVSLVSILSPGFVGTTLAVEAAQAERRKQNEKIRRSSPDELLASDSKNLQISYAEITEMTYDKKYLRIKFGGSTARVRPMKSGGFLGYAHPDAVPDPDRLMGETIATLKGVPSVASKIAERR
jgi:hypothetical protein